MKSAFYIMKLWQTGNVGSHNIEELSENPKEGYKTYNAAVNAFDELKAKSWDMRSGLYTFTILEIFQP